MLSTTRAEAVVLQQCRAPSHQQQQPFPRCQAVPSPATTPMSSPAPWQPMPPGAAAGEPCAPGWGTAGVFIPDYCVSWPTVRWGQGQENELGQDSQGPADSQHCERTGGLHSLAGDVAKGTASRAVARHKLHRGVLLLILSSLPLELFVLLQDQPLFPNSHTRTRVIIIMINN